LGGLEALEIAHKKGLQIYSAFSPYLYFGKRDAFLAQCFDALFLNALSESLKKVHASVGGKPIAK